MATKPDARVQDRVALDEIELYGELIIAASSSSRPLSVAEIDQVLGVDRERPVIEERAPRQAARDVDSAG